jgi:hypothetical protein
MNIGKLAALLVLLALLASTAMALARSGRTADDCGTDAADTDCQSASTAKGGGQSKSDASAKPQ